MASRRSDAKKLVGMYGENIPVRPTLCAFDAEQVASVGEIEIYPNSPKDIKDAFDKRFPGRKPSRRWRGAGRKASDALPQATDRFEALGYSPQALLARSNTAFSYKLLVQVIGALGPAAGSVPPLRDFGSFEQHRERALNACAAFASVFQPDAWCAYIHDRADNHVSFLGFPKEPPGQEYETPNGLLHSPAMLGIVRKQDLPARVLFDHSSPVRLVYPPFPPLPSNASPPSPVAGIGFIKRESIDPHRRCAVRLIWGTSKLALFLNWRKSPPVQRSDDIGCFLSTLSTASDERDDVKLAQAVKPLELAVRYFIGWMAAAGIDLTRTYRENKGNAPAHEIVRRIAEASGKPTDLEQAGKLEEAVSRALGQDSAFVNVHWCDLQAKELVLKKGNFVKHSEPQPSFSYNPPDGEIKESNCAQAAYWARSLLVDYKPCPGEPYEKHLVDIAVRRQDLQEPASEIIVPFGASSEVIGVTSVEKPGTGFFRPYELHCTELITHLYAKLRAYARSGRECSVIQDLSNPYHQGSSFQEVCKRFCEWVRLLLGADTVYILLFDSKADIWRPIGVTHSLKLVLRYISTEAERRNWGLHSDQDKNLWNKVVQEYRKQKKPEGIHALFEHTIAGRLLRAPLRNVYTQNIFETKDPKFIEDVRNDLHIRNEATKAYFSSLLGWPFHSDERVQSDGVMWICWIDPLEKFEKGKEADVKGWVKDKIDTESRILSAVYSIYRFQDPERAADPLPFIKPS